MKILIRTLFLWIFLLQICPGGKYKSGILPEEKSKQPREALVAFDFSYGIRSEKDAKHLEKIIDDALYNGMLRYSIRLYDSDSRQLPRKNPVFIEMKQNILEIRMVVDIYSIHFRYMIAFIFKYLADKVPCVKLSFFTKSSEKDGGKLLVPYSNIFFDGRDGTLTLDWTPDESGTYIEDIITYITYQNPRIQKFVYGSEENEQNGTAILERILSSLRYCENLRILYLKNHYEKKVDGLLELLKSTQIKELDISSWMLEDDSEWHMILGFLENYAHIESLCVSGNYLSNDTLCTLGALVAHSSSLKKLEMVPQDVFTEEGAQVFLEGIDRENSNIEYISLGASEILGSHWLDIEEKLRESLTNFELEIFIDTKEEESSESENEYESDDTTVASNEATEGRSPITEFLPEVKFIQGKCDDSVVDLAIPHQMQDLSSYMPLTKKQKPNN
ncbi:MAG: hypothetical protein ACSW8C_03295 [bacterium]